MLDKYIITNKNSKFYGRYVWQISEPTEDGYVRFILDSDVRIRLKMSSVRLIKTRYPDGYRFFWDVYEHWYTIVCINYSGDRYRAKGDGQWYNVSVPPWVIPTMKAQVI